MMLVNHLVVSLTGWHIAAQSGTIPDPLNAAPWAYSLVALGTALPDIDHPDSTLGSRVKWLSWPIRLLFGHRNITHSLLVVVALAYAASLYPVLTPIVFGYAFHLVGDWMTPAGVKIFWPIKRAYRSPVTVPTNSAIEYIAVWGLSALSLTLIYTT